MTLRVLIMGLPGSGKTSLARELAPLLRAVWFDGDATRALWPDLGYRRSARITQAIRMAHLCELVNTQGFNAVASFVCPVPEARAVFRATHVIWLDRIKACKYPDTNALFVPPARCDLRLERGTIEEWINETSLYLWSAEKWEHLARSASPPESEVPPSRNVKPTGADTYARAAGDEQRQ